MRKWFAFASLLVVGGSALAASDLLLVFRGAIGVQPVSAVDPATGAASPNVVRGVSAGGPWVIRKLEATIRTDGRIEVKGRGLLLAAGNGIGTNVGQSVHATLFCGPPASATAHSTPTAGVPLASDGDFRIEDTLSPVPPNPCTSPVLLIENTGGRWFAAGLLANGDD